MAFEHGKKHKILFDAYPLEYRFSGEGQFCYNLLSEYGSQGEPDMEFRAFIRKKWRDNLTGLKVKVLEAGWLQRHHQDWMKDFIFGSCDLWHITSELARIVSIPKRAKVVFTIHGLHVTDEGSEEEIRQALNRTQALADRADIIVTNSDWTTGVVKKNLNVPDDKLRRIYLGVNLSDESSKPARAPVQKFLFTVGTFVARKNFQVLIPMIKELPYKLVIAGKFANEYREFIRREIVKFGAEDQVLLLNEITEAEKNWCYRHCEAFLVPSIAEGFGIPVIEALYFGRPVVVNRVGSLPEIGKDYACYWDNFLPREMARIVKESISRPPDMSKRKAYALSYSWAEAAKDYLAIYRSLLTQEENYN